jgi:hypothetical protein
MQAPPAGFSAQPRKIGPIGVVRKWLNVCSARPRRYSGRTIAVASFDVGALIRIAAGWGLPELRFGMYFPAILISGLLAGVPAASGVTIAFILFLTWALVPITMWLSVALRAPCYRRRRASHGSMGRKASR